MRNIVSTISRERMSTRLQALVKCAFSCCVSWRYFFSRKNNLAYNFSVSTCACVCLYVCAYMNYFSCFFLLSSGYTNKIIMYLFTSKPTLFNIHNLHFLAFHTSLPICIITTIEKWTSWCRSWEINYSPCYQSQTFQPINLNPKTLKA